jgi:hypothetical protein
VSSPRTRLTAVALVLASWLVAAPTAWAAPARPADDFVESVGVNVHLSYDSSSPYRNYPMVEQKLSELGVRYIRDGIHPGQPFQYQELRRLADRGIRTDVIVGDPLQRWGIGPLPTQLALIKSQLGGAVASLEAPNEYDNQGDPNWAANLRSYQQQLWTLAKADPALASYPIVGPSFVSRDSQQALGDIRPWTDYGNIHPYPGGDSPDRDSHMDAEMAAPTASVGSKPLQATETGYHNALNFQGGHKPASEAAAGVYYPRLYLDYFRRGISRTFGYELIDQRPDPGMGDDEARFGLLRNDWSEKPAFVAMRRLIALMSDQGAAFSPTPLDYSIQGGRSSLRQMLFQKRDGTYLLALWNADRIWDPTTRQPITPDPGTVHLTLPSRAAQVDVYRPNDSDAPVLSRSAVSSLDLDVSPSVSVVKITPAGDAAPPEPLPAPGDATPVQNPPSPAPTAAVPAPTRPPASAATPARLPLSGDEARTAVRLLTLAQAPHPSRSQRLEKRKLERWLQARAATIRRQARHGGWHRARRLTRFRAITAVLHAT